MRHLKTFYFNTAFNEWLLLATSDCPRLRFDVFMHWLCARYELFLRLRLRLQWYSCVLPSNVATVYEWNFTTFWCKNFFRMWCTSTNQNLMFVWLNYLKKLKRWTFFETQCTSPVATTTDSGSIILQRKTLKIVDVVLLWSKILNAFLVSCHQSQNTYSFHQLIISQDFFGKCKFRNRPEFLPLNAKSMWF